VVNAGRQCGLEGASVVTVECVAAMLNEVWVAAKVRKSGGSPSPEESSESPSVELSERPVRPPPNALLISVAPCSVS